jgi:hypothetical protein
MKSGFFLFVKALLENESRRGTICHVRATATAFRSCLEIQTCLKTSATFVRVCEPAVYPPTWIGDIGKLSNVARLQWSIGFFRQTKFNCWLKPRTSTFAFRPAARGLDSTSDGHRLPIVASDGWGIAELIDREKRPNSRRSLWETS